MRKHMPTPNKKPRKDKPSIIYCHWGNLAEVVRYFLQTRHIAGQSTIEATEEADRLWYDINQHTLKPGK